MLGDSITEREERAEEVRAGRNAEVRGGETSRFVLWLSRCREERLHRTHREEGLTEEALTGYYAALDAMERWDEYYNYKRPHSAIKYLVPADYYRGNPDDRIAERKEKLVQAVEMRQAYWQRKEARDQGQTLT